MIKRIFIGTAALLGLIAMSITIGAGWMIYKTQQHLIPPPNPPGQPSIAEYAVPAPDRIADPPDLLGEFSWEHIAEPPKAARAWTRWWWPGGDVEEQELIDQLKVLDEAGFGGVEVQPFISGVMAVMDNESVMERVYSFDTPEYYRKLNAAIAAAAERELQFDLTLMSGWPPGGPQVNLEDSLTIVAYGEVRVRGGRDLSVTLPRPRPGPSEYIFSAIEFSGADFINFPADHARLLSVVAARQVDGRRARNPFDVSDTVVLDSESLLVLTDNVKDGVLRWQAPEGRWHIVASYLMPSGEVPIGGAQSPQGFVFDHLRVPQVLGHYEYAFGERTGLPGHYGTGLRGFFNDSLEFRLKRMAVDDILDEFHQRRGYDLEPYLPAIYIEGMDNMYFREILGIHAAPEFQLTPHDERIRHDYQQTLSDLVIERFIETSAEWAEQRGLSSRGQSYGMDLDLLRALGANSIPETEQLWAGGMNAGLKFASSAAALYGRPLVAAESFVWINRDYTVTARRVKATADKLFLAGINHIIYHGTPYSWRGGEPSPFGEEGWAPFSGPGNPANFSENVSPGNTALWPDVPMLNDYIARSQYLLRQGGPDIDVLIYYPFLGFHGPNPAESEEALVTGRLPDADPTFVSHEAGALTAGRGLLDRLMTLPPEHTDERGEWVGLLQPLLSELERRGISWAWLNGHSLESGKVEAGVLSASGGRYRSILLPNVDGIDVATLQSLEALAGQGVPVYLAGRLPSRQPGFREMGRGDQLVREQLDRLMASGAKPLDMITSVLTDVLASHTATELRYDRDSGIQHYPRILAEGGSIHFFSNQTPGTEQLDLLVEETPELWWFDAVEGVAWPARVSESRLSLTLSGFESRFLITGVPIPAAVQQRRSLGEAVVHNGERRVLDYWDFEMNDFSANWRSLPDWRDVEALRYAPGVGRYRHRFVLDNVTDGQYLLDLGLVQGSAEVSVNGRVIGRASFPPFLLDISDALKPGENEILVEVRAPLRNTYVGYALAGDERYKHMRRYKNGLVAAGLIGPVSMVRVEVPAT